MFDARQFFMERFSTHLKETSRYLKYIFNGHIAIAMLFIVSALAFYYQQWLATIPDNFPTAIIIAIGFGFIASYSPVRTLLKEPDIIFLLPAEHKMSAYFRFTLLYSFIIQVYLVLLLAAVLGPLYFASYPNQAGSQYLLIVLVLFILKFWNLLANWWMLKIRDYKSRWTDQIIRFVLNAVTFYFFVKAELLLAGITTILLFLLFVYNYYLSKQQPGIAWDLLIEKDNMRMRTFYRIANMFTDVPHLKMQVKKRHVLVSFLTSRIAFHQDKSFDYLYRITLVRSGDYLGMYLRLIFIGGLAVYYVPNIWLKVIFTLLFLYLSAFQLMTLWQHHRTITWLDLYPVSTETRQKALVSLLMSLMLIQVVAFLFLFLVIGQMIGLITVGITGVVFSYLFVHGYVKPRLT
ncbi:ABC transporter permease [Aquibacillus koreensis]|uniref:ABC transporter permease n=1 Tax=Aquibacillus koreensis TaxID=279446 RepID=A0A9X4AHX3_9BACI|nr:ABC transporter permease [Aquibacillus koreensis]MCT2535571.1 ABC transporter permease [Aquibacillus koreensis]MDC3420144.1 ABC transporter permease [Aquibacillus koreensis]